jgi:assimilatory nitrate reductase catalytic subunit
LTWWSRAQAEQGLRYEIAGRSVPGNWSVWAKCLLGAGAQSDWFEYEDAGAVKYRAAWCNAQGLQAVLSVAPRPQLPSRIALLELFKKARLTAADRLLLLGGRVAAEQGSAVHSDSIVCACFSVTRNTLKGAIEQGCQDIASLGRRVKAGTNCGSCLPELRRLICDCPQ